MLQARASTHLNPHVPHPATQGPTVQILQDLPLSLHPQSYSITIPPPTQHPAPSFGSVVAKTVAHHLFKHSRFTQLNLVQTDPAMSMSSLSNPELQAKFPEAYAFAVRVDRFGKEQIALLKVTMEPSKPHLFKEFALLGRLLKKGTGHDLYTPGVHTEGFQPVAIKVEAMVLEAAQFTKSFALQRLNNPIQADIDVTLGVLRGAGELAKGTFRFLLDTHNPNDVISRDMLSTLDILASNIDMRFTSMIHQINPGYDPYSPASKAGSELFKALIFERILIGKTAAITRGGARALTGLAARSEVAYVEQRALLRPAYRGGFAGEKTVAKLADRNIKAVRTVNRSSNHTHIAFIENGEIKTISMGDMSHAGTLPDKGPLSKAGRALQKKSDRLDSAFPKPSGTSHEVNLQGQKVLDEILNHPDKVVIRDTTKKRYGGVFDIKIGSEKGMGVRFKTNGEFVGFLEPK
ncbi:MAG: hypothetical protein KFB95_01350 [Simkaniaceae bacterium]|nr:MAG: hypothetical protein KFB95_01350 [Simkaniaceae bacterium]